MDPAALLHGMIGSEEDERAGAGASCAGPLLRIHICRTEEPAGDPGADDILSYGDGRNPLFSSVCRYRDASANRRGSSPVRHVSGSEEDERAGAGASCAGPLLRIHICTHKETAAP